MYPTGPFATASHARFLRCCASTDGPAVSKRRRRCRTVAAPSCLPAPLSRLALRGHSRHLFLPMQGCDCSQDVGQGVEKKSNHRPTSVFAQTATQTATQTQTQTQTQCTVCPVCPLNASNPDAKLPDAFSFPSRAPLTLAISPALAHLSMAMPDRGGQPLAGPAAPSQYATPQAPHRAFNSVSQGAKIRRPLVDPGRGAE